MTTVTLTETSIPTPPARGGLKKRSWRPTFGQVVLGVPVIFMAVIYAYPVGGVLVRSFTDPSFGLGNFAEAAGDPTTLKVLWITTRLAAIVAVITVVLGFPLAYFMSVASSRTARILTILVIVPFWTSVLVRSFAWIVLLGDGSMISNFVQRFTGGEGGLMYTEPAVIIAMSHVLLPFAVLIIRGTLDQIDGSLMRAARTLGAGPIRAFLKVYLPLAAPAMVSSGMLVFIMGLGYYITPALVGGPAQTTIAMLIEQKVNLTFEWGMAAALSTVLLLISVALYILVKKLTKVNTAVSM